MINNYLQVFAIVLIVSILVYKATKSYVENKGNEKGLIETMFYDNLPYILAYAETIENLFRKSDDEEVCIYLVSELIYSILYEKYHDDEKMLQIISRENIKKHLYPILRKMYETKIIKSYVAANKNI